MKTIKTILLCVLASILGLTLVISCNSDDTDDTATDSDTDADTDTDTDTDSDADFNGLCPLDEKVGLFQISHLKLYSAVTGNVKGDVVPITIEFPQEEDGDCMLLQKINPTCDPPCDSDEACAHGDECVPGDCEGVCVPYPVNENAGTVDVTGLTTTASIEPNVVFDYSLSTSPSEDNPLDHPPFVSGSNITLTAAGADIEAFTLKGRGVTPMVAENTEWVIERDEDTLDITSDLEITWTPSNDNAEIYARLNIDQHGNSPATMHCFFEDDGSATIPISLLETFTQYGVTGYASAFLARRTVDSTWIDEGCVQLETASIIMPDLSVTNHDPDVWPTDD